MNVETIFQYWWVKALIIPAVLMVAGRVVKKEALCKWAKKLESVGAALSKIGAVRIGRKGWERLEETILITLIDTATVALQSLKRGLLKDNIKRAMEKKIDPELTTAYNDSLKEMAKR